MSAQERIARALPELDERARRRLLSDSERAAKKRVAFERAFEGFTGARLCARLRWVGFELLHEIDAPIFLLPPLGSPFLARRALAEFGPDRRAEQAVVWRSEEHEELAALARRAVVAGAAIVLAWALPEKGRRFTVHLESPLSSPPGDDAAALAERCIATLAGLVRRHPRHWDWGSRLLTF